MGRPVPSTLAVAVLAAGLVPAVLAILAPGFAWAALALDLAVLVLCAVDFALAPHADALEVRRYVEDILSSGVANRVQLEIESRAPARRMGGEVRDTVPPGVAVEGHRQRFVIDERSGLMALTYRVTPPTRGDLHFGDVFVRLTGPLDRVGRPRPALLPAQPLLQVAEPVLLPEASGEQFHHLQPRQFHRRGDQAEPLLVPLDLGDDRLDRHLMSQHLP